ncbi:carbonic anhydrase 15 [Drosophila eugracilis]|uniref:carbonic anhydrase 15 n=1 Tax=Drosophila eugracilis TaxID=29029 RepID=UPI001BDB393C|nr:carbonic anhydrase 15 [Drosophila eugracilis]XP_017072730.2 carbonic anhydrase 15 [Drosophila eugracilis]
MLVPIFKHLLVKFLDYFGLVMKLAENSWVIMILVSSTMALAFILNVYSGRTIFRDVANTVANMRTQSMLKLQPSPINISENVVQRKRLNPPLQWTHYEDLPMATVLQNNGNTVILRVYTPINFLPYLSGAELEGRYYFVEAIFKWGTLQSEHSIGNQKFCLEMQALHRCLNQNGTFEFLTLSYLFKISPYKNEELKQICDHLKWILHPGSTIELPPFELGFLIRPFTGSHYTYNGTYDNGEMTVATTWFINKAIFNVNSLQLAQFAALYREDGKRMTSNGRPEQPLGHRCVYFNY